MYRNPFTGRPFRPRFDVPEVFGEALSYEDQILWLAKHFKRLKDKVDSLDINQIKEDVLDAARQQTQAMLDAFIIPVNQRLNDMEAKIDAATTGGLIYDPTQGAYVPSKDAMRRMYAALVQTGTSHVYDMDYLTVAEMSGKTVHAYSVAGLAEVGWSNEIGPTDPDAPATPEVPNNE